MAGRNALHATAESFFAGGERVATLRRRSSVMKGRDSFAEDSEVGDQGGRHPRAVSPLPLIGQDPILQKAVGQAGSRSSFVTQ